MTVPGPAGRASREQRIEAVAKELSEGHGGCTGICSNRPCEVDYRSAAKIVDALDRLSPSGEGEEREWPEVQEPGAFPDDFTDGLHERGGQT